MRKKLDYLTIRISFFLGISLLVITTGLRAQEKISLPSIPYDLEWIHTPKNYSINENSLTITAGERTNMFRSPKLDFIAYNAPMLVFQPKGNFSLTATIELDFVGMWDAGCFVVMKDSLNWIKYCFEKDYTSKKRVVSVVTKDRSDDCNSMEIKSKRIFYKLIKSDEVIVLYYSTNGNNWFMVRNIHFDFGTDYKVGFLSQSPVGKECTAKFSDIKYVEKDDIDPYNISE